LDEINAFNVDNIDEEEDGDVLSSD